MTADAIRILHLSDFHFSAKTKWDSSPVLRGLAEAIGRLVQDGLTPDVVAITGDVAQSGKAKDYAQAAKWFEERLLPVLPKGFRRDRLLMVPGNHDVDRDGLKTAAESLQSSILAKRSQEMVAKILTEKTDRSILLKRHAAYLKFANAVRCAKPPVKFPWWSEAVEINGSRIFFVGLCSSWMAGSEDDKGKLVISRWQVNTLFENAPKDADFMVVLMHHPWDYLADFDALEIQETVRRDAGLVLRGHLHAQRSATIYDPDNASVELAVGSAYAGSELANSFQLVEVLVAERKVRIHYRIWHNGEWMPDRNAYRGADDGTAMVPLDRPSLAAKPIALPARQQDPRKYLEGLRQRTASIEIRGLKVGTGEVILRPIERIYIPLAALPAMRERAGNKTAGGAPEPIGPERGENTDLREALKDRCLVVVGDPGAGKSTFLRRVAFELCRRQLGESGLDQNPAWQALGTPFPMFIRLAELAQHKAVARESKVGPLGDDAPCWLAHFAGTQSLEGGAGLDEVFFRAKMENGKALVLLDGLDEGPSEDERIALRKLIERAAAEYGGCRFVVTTRPAAYKDEVLLSGFKEARIASLDERAIDSFLADWCAVSYPGSEGEIARHVEELRRPLREKPEIRLMARNPVMLTALAVVHWHEGRLPEQRAELYESVIGWLARSRKSRRGRPLPDHCITLLQGLALAMQDHPKGRQAQVARHWGARAIAPSFRDVPEDQSVRAAEEFLRQEEVDSGIVMGRGANDICFWHLTFQEHLAARALRGRPEMEVMERLLASDKLYAPEWREVVLLLAGALHRDGVERVDWMFRAILDRLGAKARLSDKARSAGLLSAILRDLWPVKYRPEDKRYKAILDAVLAIFDARQSKEIPIEAAIEAAEAIGQAGDPRFAELSSADLWVTIPAGEFGMGAQAKKTKERNHDPGAYDNESPVHKVTLEAYRIGRCPVTVAEYRRFVEDGGYAKKELWRAGGFQKWRAPDGWDEQTQHPNRPVVEVSWFEAMAYAVWASCRLPTEAEWERAARGTDGRKYPWGDREKPSRRLLNYAESRINHPTPVGVYPLGATAEGVCDMAGNVWEWCSDWFGAYVSDDQENPAGPCEGQGRVLRGGAWPNYARRCRTTYRDWLGPDGRGGNLGFRVAAGT